MVSTTENYPAANMTMSSLALGTNRFFRSVVRMFALTFLTPTISVRLLRQTGRQERWFVHGDSMSASRGSGEGKARFCAVEIPEELLLWRTLKLPAIAAQDLFDVVALDVKANSPFPVKEVVWTYRQLTPESDGVMSVQTVMAQRARVEQHIKLSLSVAGLVTKAEAWVFLGNKSPMVLGGFGESARIQYLKVWQRINGLLIVLALCLLTGIALTSSLQLRYRAIEANAMFEAERDKVVPVVKKRASYQDTLDRLSEVEAVTKARVDPLWLMDRITQIVPDDTSLLTLQVQSTKVTMTGQTTNAAMLMKHLSSQSGVHDVKAPVAAVRPPGATKDSFNIEFTLSPKSLVSPTPASQSSAVASIPVNSVSSPAPAASAQSAIGAKGTQ